MLVALDERVQAPTKETEGERLGVAREREGAERSGAQRQRAGGCYFVPLFSRRAYKGRVSMAFDAARKNAAIFHIKPGESPHRSSVMDSARSLLPRERTFASEEKTRGWSVVAILFFSRNFRFVRAGSASMSERDIMR